MPAAGAGSGLWEEPPPTFTPLLPSPGVGGIYSARGTTPSRAGSCSCLQPAGSILHQSFPKEGKGGERRKLTQAVPCRCLLLLSAAPHPCEGCLLAITVDRYLSLYNALTYHSERTLGFTCAMVLLMWLLCLGVGLLPLLGWNCLRDQSACSILRPVTKDNAAVLAVTFLLLFALMMQLYLQICKIAFRHAQQIAVQHQFIATAQATSTRKGLSTLSLILGTFALCWIPFAIYSLVADSSYPVVYTYSLALPATCNSLINPIIYAFRNPDIQKSLWLACCGCIPSTFSSRPRTSSDV
uniref:G-protein coupled receptors family 1 profile domain-containing protein n=1 Tax=Bubo bubo TaxID=30461 RepID=A0A8C0EBR6_BUBBB